MKKTNYLSIIVAVLVFPAPIPHQLPESPGL